MKKRILALMMSLSLVLALAACGDSASSEASATESTTAESSEATTEAGATNVDGETRLVTTARGEVEIPAHPQRIADISGMSDVLYVLGHHPVATADADAYDRASFPAYLEQELEGAVIVGYGMSETVDVEGVLSTEPDLIIINHRQEAVIDQLSAIATTIVIEPDVNDWRGDIRMVASLFGQEEDAEAFIADYEAKAAEIGAAVLEAHGPETTIYSFLAGENSHFLFTGAAFGDIFYNDFGLGVPEALPEQDSITLPTVDLEGLTEIESDIIVILASDENRAFLESSAVFNTIEAVQNGNVIWLSNSPYFNQAYSCYGRYKLMDELLELLGA